MELSENPASGFRDKGTLIPQISCEPIVYLRSDTAAQIPSH